MTKINAKFMFLIAIYFFFGLANFIVKTEYFQIVGIIYLIPIIVFIALMYLNWLKHETFKKIYRAVVIGTISFVWICSLILTIVFMTVLEDFSIYILIISISILLILIPSPLLYFSKIGIIKLLFSSFLLDFSYIAGQ